MHILRSWEELRKWRNTPSERGLSLGFVPTMGALHAGHLSLVALASEECARVLTSIFVNPTQFNRAEDLALYPRTEDADFDLLRTTSCDAVFIPSVQEIYGASEPGPAPRHYDLGELESVLEGAHRPGHFQGVARILDVFFRRIEPQSAFFGEKDFQQLAVVRRLVETESLGVRIVEGPTHREPDGLAMSSRNLRLTPQARAEAPAIYRELHRLSKTLTPYNWPAELERSVDVLNRCSTLEVEYLEIAHRDRFSPYDGSTDLRLGPWRLFAAVHASGVRLIDNCSIE